MCFGVLLSRHFLAQGLNIALILDQVRQYDLPTNAIEKPSGAPMLLSAQPTRAPAGQLGSARAR
jgi:hypothetical protein